MHETRAHLGPRFQLPDGWSDVETVHDTVTIDGVAVERAGVAATSPLGVEVTGSASATRGSTEFNHDVVDRSWFELLERAGTLEAGAREQGWPVRNLSRGILRIAASATLFPSSDSPDIWRYARSNGVALHSSWEEACRRARLELIERHRLLAAWYGQAAHERAANSETNEVVKFGVRYEWHTRRMLPTPGCFSDGIEVAMVVGFSRTHGPMAIGFGAAEDLPSAVESATRESVQLLSFLWDEPVCETVTTVPGARLHLEHFQTRAGQEALCRWMNNGGSRDLCVRRRSSAEGVCYVDLTPSSANGLHVVKALHADAWPLAFGNPPFVRHLPAPARIHPIP